MELREEMTIEEMENRFDSERVLINDPVLDSRYQVQRGEVRYHNPSREEVDAAVDRIGSDMIAVRYIGEMPGEARFLL